MAQGPRTSARTVSLDDIRLLAGAGTAGILFFWGVVVALGVLRPDYSWVRDAISDLGAVGAPYGVVQQVAFVVLGAGILAVALALDRAVRTGAWPWVGVILLGVLGVLGAVGPGVFPVDRANPAATTNLLHAIVTPLGFLAGLVGIPLTTWRLARSDAWPAYESYWVVVGVTVALVAAFATFVTLVVGGSAVSGFAQRLYAGAMCVWLVAHAVVLYRLPAAST